MALNIDALMEEERSVKVDGWAEPPCSEAIYL